MFHLILSAILGFAAGGWIVAKFSHRLGWQQGFWDGCQQPRNQEFMK